MELTQLLVLNGADVHAHNDRALTWASMCGHLEVVKFLVLNGANMNGGALNGHSAAVAKFLEEQRTHK